MPKLLSELRKILQAPDGPARLIWAESDWPEDQRALSVDNFLGATMDEVRLFHANRCVEEILRPLDMDDANFFRIGVLRREITGSVSYPKHRDHSAHTLHNYLLGWYFVAHCPVLREALSSEFDHRRIPTKKRLFEECFADIWPYVSLLHDVGYLFEGSLGLLSTAVQDSQIEIGASVVDEYFASYFWNSIGFGSIDDRRMALEFANYQPPDFSHRSVAAISDHLRFLGQTDALLSFVKKSMKGLESLPTDAFDLWNEHYSYFDRIPMVQRLDAIRRVYERHYLQGLGSSGLRLLDHGVCGGLLLLLQVTFYFSLRCGLRKVKAEGPRQAQLCSRFESGAVGYFQPSWWWSSLVWGCAATAIHNIQQMDAWPSDYHAHQLTIEEDPLAYLGILVDCLEEWDRFTSSRDSVLSGVLPLQGKDVLLNRAAGRIVIDYRTKKSAEKVRRSLDTALRDWSILVTVLPA